MARRKVKGSYSGIAELLRSPMMVDELVRRAEKTRALAEQIAPKRTGHYAESFAVSASRNGGARSDRAAAYVTNSDRGAASIELGTRDTPAHRTLRTAMLDGMKD